MLVGTEAVGLAAIGTRAAIIGYCAGIATGAEAALGTTIDERAYISG